MIFLSRKTVCIIFGGQSSEYEVSLLSASGMITNIDREKYEVLTLAILKDGRQFLYNGAVEKIADGSFAEDSAHLIPAIISPCPAHHGLVEFNKAEGTYKVINVDAFLPAVHGENCEDGNLQGLMKLSGVKFAGSDNKGSAVAMDKSITKALLEKFDIPMADWYLFKKGKDLTEGISECEKKLSFPIFVKPCGTGSSVGVSKAENREELEKAIKLALTYDEKVLCEETIVGTEIEVAVMDTPNGVFASLPGELSSNEGFYDYDNKYKNDTTSFYIPARLDGEKTEKVRELAKTIFKALDCRGYSRVDFFNSEKGLIFNEINTLPGFTKISMFPKLMENMGISYKELITQLIENI